MEYESIIVSRLCPLYLSHLYFWVADFLSSCSLLATAAVEVGLRAIRMDLSDKYEVLRDCSAISKDPLLVWSAGLKDVPYITSGWAFMRRHLTLCESTAESRARVVQVGGRLSSCNVLVEHYSIEDLMCSLWLIVWHCG